MHEDREQRAADLQQCCSHPLRVGLYFRWCSWDTRSEPAMKMQVRRNRVLALGQHETEENNDWCNDTWPKKTKNQDNKIYMFFPDILAPHFMISLCYRELIMRYFFLPACFLTKLEYIYIYIYVCVYRIYIYIYVCVYRIYIYVYVYIYIYTYTHLYIYIYILILLKSKLVKKNIA